MPLPSPLRSIPLLPRLLASLAIGAGLGLAAVAVQHSSRFGGAAPETAAETAQAALFTPRLGEVPVASALRSPAFAREVEAAQAAVPVREVEATPSPVHARAAEAAQAPVHRVRVAVIGEMRPDPGEGWSAIAWAPVARPASLALTPRSALPREELPQVAPFLLSSARPSRVPPARPDLNREPPRASAPLLRPSPRPAAIVEQATRLASLPSLNDASPLLAEPAVLVSAPIVSAPLASLLPRSRPSRDVPREVPATAGVVAAVASALSETVQPSQSCPAALASAIPRRPGGAAAGSAALARLGGIGGRERDRAILRELEAGNLPDHLRQLVPVELSGSDSRGQRARIVICVMPDYLAVGSDRDFVRVPMGLPAANRVAARYGMMLPTAHMVDAIHRAARVRLSPSPMQPGAQMESTEYLLRHNATIERQRGGRPLGLLVSGHKKDLVLSNRLTRVAGRVAIYGWHQSNGRPIQPLSTVHGANYADYSHGIRLIGATAWLNGRAVSLQELLGDARYAGILSGEEGTLPVGRLASL